MVIAGALAVAAAEVARLPRGSVWLIAAAAAVVAGLIRGLTSRRR